MQEIAMKELPILVTNKILRLILVTMLTIGVVIAAIDHNWSLLIISELTFVLYYIYIKSQLVDLKFNFIQEMLDLIHARLGIIESQGSLLLEDRLNWHKEQIRQKEEKIQQLAEEFDISSDN